MKLNLPLSLGSEIQTYVGGTEMDLKRDLFTCSERQSVFNSQLGVPSSTQW